MFRQLTYPAILCFLFAVQGLVLGGFILNILITPIVIVLGVCIIFRNINVHFRSVLKIYWVICLIKRTISIKTFLKINAEIKELYNLSDLVFKMTGSSLTDIQILQQRYNDGIQEILQKCDYSADILSKICTISIGCNIIYIIIKFTASINQYLT